ncbi:MAG: DUF1501 domain-containing protein [Granulosicoccus sp.]
MDKKRQFLKAAIAALISPVGFVNQATLAGSRIQPHRRLVMVELAGANDGLNTLVPFTNDFYYRLRPTLGLRESQLIKLDNEQAMHSSLQPLQALWNAGELAWVQGLGYPKPNRSHFQSIALWETAGDGISKRGDRGWLTHAIEHQLARNVIDPHGISLAGDLSIFASSSGRWLSIANGNQLPKSSFGLPSARNVDHPALAVVQSRTQTLNATLSLLAEKMASVPEVPRFKGGSFGEQLRQVAMFIAAGIDTPVYRVRLDGFDTHDQQLGRHDRLLTTLADGLGSFTKALKSMGEWNNTLTMSYSEFGRRAAENRSAGTDHGTAAPHVLLGGAVRGGVYGSMPDLSELVDGDPAHTMDYRALYRAVLSQGLGIADSSDSLAGFADSRLTGIVRSV